MISPANGCSTSKISAVMMGRAVLTNGFSIRDLPYSAQKAMSCGLGQSDSLSSKRAFWTGIEARRFILVGIVRSGSFQKGSVVVHACLWHFFCEKSAEMTVSVIIDGKNIAFVPLIVGTQQKTPRYCCV